MKIDEFGNTKLHIATLNNDVEQKEQLLNDDEKMKEQLLDANKIKEFIKNNENDLIKKFDNLSISISLFQEFLDVAIKYNQNLIPYIISYMGKNFSENNVFNTIQYGNKELFINLNNKFISKKRMKDHKEYIKNILYKAIYFNKLYVFEEIFNKNISFSNYMYSLKEEAIILDRIDILKFLFEIEKTVFFKTTDKNIKYFFHLTIHFKHVEILQYFIDNGMNVNSVYDRQRPIYRAIITENCEVIKILAKAKAELYIKGHSIVKPIEIILNTYAYNNSNYTTNMNEILKVLLTYMKDAEIIDCLKKFKKRDSNIFLKISDTLVVLNKEMNFIHYFI